MKKKDIVILDTNFIVEHKKDFESIVTKIRDSYDLYLPIIAINERVAQRWREIRKKYDEIEKIKSDYSDIIKSIYYKISFEKKAELDEKTSRNAYNELFNGFIIDLPNNDNTFKDVLNRAYKKIPPFINEDKASDKGFKDTLLWLSILNFFKDKKLEVKIFLISNDGGFIKYSKELKKEFKDVTGLEIEVVDNCFYNNAIDNEQSSDDKVESQTKKDLDIYDRQILRERISNILDNFCNNRYEDYYGNEICDKIFKLESEYKTTHIKSMLDSLSQVLKDNAFSKLIKPSMILPSEIVFKEYGEIPMTAIEDLYSVYKDIQASYNEYETAFINEITRLINKNVEKSAFDTMFDDSDLPF